MLTTHKAIVLSSIKYADYDLIVKCYTDQGIKSYIIKRIYKQSKGKLTPAFFLPLTQLEITAKYSEKRTLHFINEAKISYPYTTVFSNIIKQTIAIFLAELLTTTLREEESNTPLFSFLETSLQWFDTRSNATDFHLIFLMRLTKYLGFYPEIDTASSYFDLLHGRFTNHLESNYFISGELLINFMELLQTNFDTENHQNYKNKTRQELLDVILQYYELHVPDYKKPKSLEVFKTIFH